MPTLAAESATVSEITGGKFVLGIGLIVVAQSMIFGLALNLHDDVGDGFTASAMNFKADLGAGNDVFAANVDYGGQVFRVDDHSVASIAVKGGAGNDSLSVKGVPGAGTIRLDADAHQRPREDRV